MLSWQSCSMMSKYDPDWVPTILAECTRSSQDVYDPHWMITIFWFWYDHSVKSIWSQAEVHSRKVNDRLLKINDPLFESLRSLNIWIFKIWGSISSSKMIVDLKSKDRLLHVKRCYIFKKWLCTHSKRIVYTVVYGIGGYHIRVYHLVIGWTTPFFCFLFFFHLPHLL